jgi:hypothetical protein
MKTRLSLLLLCSSLFASFAGAVPKTEYPWTVVDSDKEILAGFWHFDVKSGTVGLEKNNRPFTIPFKRLTKNCKERVLILQDQQILQGQLDGLEQKIIRLDKLVGDEIKKLDARLKIVEAKLVNANPVAQIQQFDDARINKRLDKLEKQMEVVKRNSTRYITPQFAPPEHIP